VNDITMIDINCIFDTLKADMLILKSGIFIIIIILLLR